MFSVSISNCAHAWGLMMNEHWDGAATVYTTQPACAFKRLIMHLTNDLLSLLLCCCCCFAEAHVCE